MNFSIDDIKKLLLEEVLYIWNSIIRMATAVRNFAVKTYKTVVGATKNGIQALVKFWLALPLKTKVMSLMCVYLVFFLIWQFMAYVVSQAVFVMVNLLLVIISALGTCYMMFRSLRLESTLAKQLDELETKYNESEKKNKAELTKYKREVLQLRRTSDNRSFGKGSQKLIDAIQRYKQAAKSTDLPGHYILKALGEIYQICAGVIYMDNGEGVFKLSGSFALLDDPQFSEVTEQDAMYGEVIASGKVMELDDVPVEYFRVISGLGSTDHVNVYLLPVKKGNKVVAVAEVATLGELEAADIWKDVEGQLI